MKCGPSSIAQRTNAGYGLPYVVERFKSLLLSQEIIVLRLVPNCGQRFLNPTNAVIPLVISGMLMLRSFRKLLIVVWLRVQVRPVIWNAGIAPYVNASLALFVKRFLSPNLMSCTKSFSKGLSWTTISLVSVRLEPLPKNSVFLQVV